ncbi:MAG: hypothetical protein IJ794_00175 [Lachnospiraceae bacterium]|nr:hypothetical protein [Lachnospiraceae bacterium]
MGYRPVFRNRAKCLICGDIIESMSHYDFKTCSCGNLSVDGGHEYTRRVCKTGREGFEELSCGTETPERLVEHIMYICAFGEPRATLFRFIDENSGAELSPKEQADMVFQDIDALGKDTILKWVYEYDSVEYAKTW